MYSHRVNSPIRIWQNTREIPPPKYFPVFARVRIQAPHVFAQKLIPQEFFPACIGFVPGGMVCQTYGLGTGRLSRKWRKPRKRRKRRRQLRQLQTRSWVLDSRKSRKPRKWRKPLESRVQTTGSPNHGFRNTRPNRQKSRREAKSGNLNLFLCILPFFHCKMQGKEGKKGKMRRKRFRLPDFVCREKGFWARKSEPETANR